MNTTVPECQTGSEGYKHMRSCRRRGALDEMDKFPKK